MNTDIIQLIDNYLERLGSSTIEQPIMQQAKQEILALRKERNHLMTQFINLGEGDEKPNRSSKRSKDA
jgi:hypothetical protein